MQLLGISGDEHHWDRTLLADRLNCPDAVAREQPDVGRDKVDLLRGLGPRKVYSPERMVGGWISERTYFQPGTFPYVSRTGNWVDVSHYTQLIWSGTTRVRCAVHSSGRWDYLIRRYSPPGNIDGRRVG